MKYIKNLRTLAIALSLALLATIIPAQQALAVAAIYLDPDEGEIGQVITITGTGFLKSSASLVYGANIYFAKDEAVVFNDIDDEVDTYEKVKASAVPIDEDGEFDSTFKVPDKLNDGSADKNVVSGDYYVYITYYYQYPNQDPVDSLIIRAVADFEVIGGTLTLNRDDGAVGTEVTVTGDDFGNQENITLEYNGEAVVIASGDDDTNSSGEFEFKMLIPESTAGDHTIKVTGDESNIEASATFTVEPKVTLSPESGAAGDSITVSGTGFGGGEDVTITFGGSTVVEDETTDSNGSFTVTFAVLSVGPGSYYIEAVDDDDNSDAVQFTIAAAISLNPTTGTANDEVSVSGTGFLTSSSITIIFDDVAVKYASTDATGAFATSFIVFPLNAGTYKVEVSDGINTAEADFSVTVVANITPVTSATSPGYAGSDLTVSSTGFTAGRTVIVTYDGVQVASGSVQADGSFSASFKAPASSGGEHIIIATDGVNSRQFTFTMESMLPQTPVPLKPEMGIKAKAKAYFNWEDVTDPSGITYTLQIATAEQFSVDSIVLEKKGITVSEYTLTNDERLEPASGETLYYWHVKAIDGASNESLWSGTGAFYVSASFAIDQWVIYLLCGVGALIMGAVGFWLGKKTVYY